MHGPIETAAAAAATGTATIIETAIETAAATGRGATARGRATARGATARVTPAAIRGATVRTAMLPHAREMLRGAIARGVTARGAKTQGVRVRVACLDAMTVHAVTPRLVRMDRERTFNRGAPTTLLVVMTHRGQVSATRVGSSVRAANARDAAGVGVDVVDAMGARTRRMDHRTAVTRWLKAVATPPAGRSSNRGQMRRRSRIQRLVPRL